MGIRPWYLDNDNFIQHTSTVTGATMGVTMLDRSRVPLAGPTWPVSMTEVSAGVYEVTIDKGDITVAEKQHIIATFTADDGMGGDGAWDIYYVVVRRSALA